MRSTSWPRPASPSAVVNVHYLADALEAHLAARNAPAVTVSDERDAAARNRRRHGQGAAAAARSVLLRSTATTSGSTARATSFAELSATPGTPQRMDALLLLVPHARRAQLSPARAISTSIRSAGSRRRRSGRIAPFIYTGIQLVSHRLLRDAPEGPFSTNVLWQRAIEEGRLYGIAHHRPVVRGRHPAGHRADRGRADAWLSAAGSRPARLFDRRAPRLCRCAGRRADPALSPSPTSGSRG